MILNLLALAAIAAVAVFGARERLYHAAMTLVALVLAGAVACVLGGPVSAAIFGATTDTNSTWHYVGHALCLWAILCVVFLALRTVGHRLLPADAPVPDAAQVAGGAVFGALTGYLATGMALVVAQMLPVAPSVLGYEPFRHERGVSLENPERIVRESALWFAPDRVAVWLLDTAAGGGVRDGGGPLLAPCGDAYPPDGQRAEGYRPAVDTDDFLYVLWYRRWEAVRWRTGLALGPVPEIAPAQVGQEALPLERRRHNTLYGMKLQVYFAVRTNRVAGFADIQPPDGHEFLQVRLRMEPSKRLPRTIDSAQFTLVDESGRQVAGNPMVHGEATRQSPDDKTPEAVGSPTSPPVVARNLRFAFPTGGNRGLYVASGMRFPFTERRQYETRTLVFAVPRTVASDTVGLFMVARVPSPAEIEQMPDPGVTKPPETEGPEA